jgi:murein DD-endopeptidase MepM/ murein hydrolase activator NlpD
MFQTAPHRGARRAVRRAPLVVALAAMLAWPAEPRHALAQNITGEDLGPPSSDLDAEPAVPTREKFRWPLIGRLIAHFRRDANDGIEIAAPVGEAVHAAGDGVVTYAGDELKTYGKLILIRHDNDFVSAYADNSEISVASGDKVRRGQIIAKSGQPPNGGPPRLHFELRKAGTPVDPLKYLARM